MILSQIIVNIPRGLQARNTCRLYVIASSFECNIHIIYKGITCEMDLMDIMNLNVIERDELTLVANGKDEKDAISTLKKFLSEGKFSFNNN